MRIGLYLDMRNPPRWRRPWARHYGRWLELVEEADRLGADSVWLSEHHFFEDGYLSQPLAFAAAIAARTRQRADRHRGGPARAEVRGAARGGGGAGRRDQQRSSRPGCRRRVPRARVRGVRRRHPPPLRPGRDARPRGPRAVGRRARVVPGPVQDPVPWWGGFFGPRGVRLAGRLGMGLLAAIPELVPAYLAGLAGGRPSGVGGAVRATVEHRAGRRSRRRVAAHLGAPGVRVGLVRAVHGRGHRPTGAAAGRSRADARASAPGWGTPARSSWC